MTAMELLKKGERNQTPLFISQHHPDTSGFKYISSPAPSRRDFVRKTALVRLQAYITNTDANCSLASLGCRCARFSQHKFSRSCSLGYIRTHKESLAGGEKVRKEGRAGDKRKEVRRGDYSFASGDCCGALGVKFSRQTLPS